MAVFSLFPLQVTNTGTRAPQTNPWVVSSASSQNLPWAVGVIGGSTVDFLNPDHQNRGEFLLGIGYHRTWHPHWKYSLGLGGFTGSSLERISTSPLSEMQTSLGFRGGYLQAGLSRSLTGNFLSSENPAVLSLLLGGQIQFGTYRWDFETWTLREDSRGPTIDRVETTLNGGAYVKAALFLGIEFDVGRFWSTAVILVPNFRCFEGETCQWSLGLGLFAFIGGGRGTWNLR